MYSRKEKTNIKADMEANEKLNPISFFKRRKTRYFTFFDTAILF